MASILNASLSSGLVATGDTSGIIQLQSNGTQTVNVATNGIITNTFNSANGLVPGYQYYRLNSTVAGANATGAQSVLGVGVTLASSTIYEFDSWIYVIKTAGTTSHNFTPSFGGTATINNILWAISQVEYGASTITANTAPITTVTANVMESGITTANYYISYYMKGTVSINSGGTFIPQYTLSAAPGGAYTTQIGSYFKIAPLAASGSNVNIGSWA
jgi:predicted RecA/RadA family phage recombinase